MVYQLYLPIDFSLRCDFQGVILIICRFEHNFEEKNDGEENFFEGNFGLKLPDFA